MDQQFVDWLVTIGDRGGEDAVFVNMIMGSYETPPPAGGAYDLKLWLVDNGAGADVLDAVDRVARQYHGRGIISRSATTPGLLA